MNFTKAEILLISAFATYGFCSYSQYVPESYKVAYQVDQKTKSQGHAGIASLELEGALYSAGEHSSDWYGVVGGSRAGNFTIGQISNPGRHRLFVANVDANTAGQITSAGHVSIRPLGIGEESYLEIVNKKDNPTNLERRLVMGSNQGHKVGHCLQSSNTYMGDENNTYVEIRGSFPSVPSTGSEQKYKVFVSEGLLSEGHAPGTPHSRVELVFVEEYSLVSLEDVETFINAKEYLSYVSATEIVEPEGDDDLHKMNVTFLTKIEELTLHVIEQEKQLLALNNQIKLLKDNKKE